MSNLILEKIFEDEDLLVINKPAGVIVNTAETTVNAFTVADWMGQNYQSVFSESTEEEFKQRKGVVHRLDKDTSGLLLLAKNSQTFIALLQQFKERQIDKKYLALVHGKIAPEQGSISNPIERNPFNRKRFGVFLGGRDALTDYKLVKLFKYQGENFSLVDVQPKTGRTHQIRVHFTHLGHSLVSDILYSGRKNYQKDIKFCPRMFLHAYYLSFTHPSTDKRMELEISLPEKLKKVLDKMNSIEP